jgi:uncharacterized protein (DUF3084 family)
MAIMKESENTYTTLAELRKNYTEQLDKYYQLVQKHEKLQEEFDQLKERYMNLIDNK